MRILDDLNPQQRKAVTAAAGPVLVLAGPGSGKTRVLTHRIAYLIQTGAANPQDILAVTFTNKAAREMGGRVLRLLEPSSGPRTAGGVDVALGTFHAICARMLRREAGHLPFTNDFVIYDESDQQALIRQVMKNQHLDPKQNPPAGIHAAISRAKNELIDSETFAADTYFAEIASRVYGPYQRALLENNALDFDDLLLYTVRLLEENELVRARYRQRYPHLLVDEFQDTNTAQYVLLRLLAGASPDLFAVGDPDQSIYRWRGADYRNVHRFREDYPTAETILLEQNYRSTQNILETAMAIIDRNPGRQPKHLFTERGAGERVVLHEAFDENEEARMVVDTIALQKFHRNFEPGDCAIMYRTNAQSRALEETFLKAGLPYRLVGAQRFYGRREIKDLIAYLRLIHNPADQVSLLRVLNTPTRGIGAKTVRSLLDIAARKAHSPSSLLQELASDPRSKLFEGVSTRALQALSDFARMLQTWLACREELSLLALIDRVVADTAYRAYLDDGTEEGQERWENIEELRALAAEFTEVGLTTFLEHVALVSDQDTLTEGQNAPTLLTLHTAKGLEFRVVFIIGLDDGVLPHQRSFDEPEAMAEERRLFYVGITRAQDRLYLLRAFRRRMAGTSTVSRPSRFLDDLPAALVEGVVPGRFTRDQATFQRETTWERPLPRTRTARFKPGMRVHHPTFGEGIVQSTQVNYDDEEVQVQFEDGESKHLVASMANLTILKP